MHMYHMQIRSCSIGTNQVGLVGCFTCSTRNQQFSVGLVDQLF